MTASMKTGAKRRRNGGFPPLPFVICRGGFSPDGRARFRPPVRSRLGEAGRTEKEMEPEVPGAGIGHRAQAERGIWIQHPKKNSHWCAAGKAVPMNGAAERPQPLRQRGAFRPPLRPSARTHWRYE